MTTPPAAVSAAGLTKRYGARAAVAGLDLHVPTGVVAGFIGPNGAGKTTTMAMLLGLVRRNAGAGFVLGHDLDDPGAYLHKVGALIEGPAFWPALTGRQNLRAIAALGGHDPAQVPEVLDLVGLGGRGDDRFGEYSMGMKQRLGVAAALLGDPDLLILDEPTNGLDPAGMSEMRRLIASLARRDRTVLVSSHLLSELEQICDWLVIIDDGRLLFEGSTADFFAQAAPVVVCAPEHVEQVGALASLLRAEGLDAAAEDGEILVAVDGADARHVALAVSRVAAGHGLFLTELHTRRPSLESHYLAVVEGASS